jgi:hypothetical protein
VAGEPLGVLADRRLAVLLVAEVVSTTGAQMAWVALPWFVLGAVLEDWGVRPVFTAVAIVQTFAMITLALAGLRYYDPALSS